MLWHQWDYRVVELKTPDGLSFDWTPLDDCGEEGWELATFIPLLEPDPKGLLATTIGVLIFKRPRASS